MAHAGRALEIVVSALERHLGRSDGVEVVSPALLPDRDTGEPREVDVAVRRRVGSHDILVILECRDRRAPADVRWIEELASKRDSVGADRVVAVSSSGFTRPAREKARALRVDLRSVEQFEGPKAAQAVAGLSLQQVIMGGTTPHVVVETEVALPALRPAPLALDPAPDERRLLRIDTFEWMSMAELLSRLDVPSRLPPHLEDGAQVPVRVRLARRRILLDWGPEMHWLHGVSFVQTVRRETREIPPARVRTYTDDAGVLARRIEYSLEGRGEVVVDLSAAQRDADAR